MGKNVKLYIGIQFILFIPIILSSFFRILPFPINVISIRCYTHLTQTKIFSGINSISLMPFSNFYCFEGHFVSA